MAPSPQHTKLPIDPCPADHVIDLEAISRQAAPPYGDGRGPTRGRPSSATLAFPTIATSRKELPPPTDLAPTTLTKEFSRRKWRPSRCCTLSMGDLRHAAAAREGERDEADERDFDLVLLSASCPEPGTCGTICSGM